jgi:hypothetical protein
VIRHEARGGLADGLKQSFTRKESADWASDVGREMWLAGVQECLKLARENLRGGWGGEINGWEDLERAVERL